MYLLNLTLGQFLILFGSVSTILVALYLLDRSRRRVVVSTLRFWVAAEQPAAVHRRKRIQQPLSLILQIVSMALILLAIGELRWGTRLAAPRDHILILDTSAWMAAKIGNRSLLDQAKERARSYIRAVPSRDRIMLVRADALTTPATAFEPNRSKLEQALSETQPGATALNLDQALAFARQLEAQGGRSSGEVVYIGAGRVAERDPQAGTVVPRNFRYLPVADTVENCGLRKIGVRRSATDPGLWEIYVSARNYGTEPRTVTLALAFGGAPVGARRLVLPPNGEKESSFEYRTRAAGVLEAGLLPHDQFPGDDRAEVELPSEEMLPVAVYSDQPDLLRPLLAATPRVRAVFHPVSEYRGGNQPGLVVIDRFSPAAKPAGDSIWIDPPAAGSPIPVRSRVTDVPFARWRSDLPLGAGLRTHDFRLSAASVFEAAPGDFRIGEVAAGPVVVARPSKPKIVAIGFHPGLTAMRYELSNPLLFANVLHWMAPEVFRRWELSAGAIGHVQSALDADARASEVRVVHEDGSPVPFTVREQSLRFFAGKPGTVRVLTGDREAIYSLNLPQLWDARWEPPAEARRGLPRFAVLSSSSTDLWHWLALLGGAGLLLEWILFGRFSRGRAEVRAHAAATLRKAS